MRSKLFGYSFSEESTTIDDLLDTATQIARELNPKGPSIFFVPPVPAIRKPFPAAVTILTKPCERMDEALALDDHQRLLYESRSPRMYEPFSAQPNSELCIFSVPTNILDFQYIAPFLANRYADAIRRGIAYDIERKTF